MTRRRCREAGDGRPHAVRHPEPQLRPGADGIGDAYFPTYGNAGYDVDRYEIKVRYDPKRPPLPKRAG